MADIDIADPFLKRYDGLTDNQFRDGRCDEEGVFDPDSRVGAVAQFG
jgi:hypothetical protein